MYVRSRLYIYIFSPQEALGAFLAKLGWFLLIVFRGSITYQTRPPPLLLLLLLLSEQQEREATLGRRAPPPLAAADPHSGQRLGIS